MFDRIFLVMKMKKLLLCILSLMLCLNTSVIHAQEPASLMIVAHPDDETIWGGSHLINGNKKKTEKRVYEGNGEDTF